jgi:FkbM family methyltransferase
MISYAQNFEDVLLYRCFSSVPDGFYVDVGAYDPVIDSVTKIFYDRGWSGINIEPGSVFNRLSADRPRDINLNVAVSDHSGIVTCYEYPEYAGLSTLEEELPAALRGVATPRIELTVPCLTLNDILSNHAMEKTVNFIKIDVEGHENAIISSTNWRLFRPELLVVEATIPTTAAVADAPWESILFESGYHLVYFDGLNKFYVRSESNHLRKFFAVPVNIFDGFVKHDPQITTLESAVAQARDQLVCAERERADFHIALNETRDRLVCADRERDELQVAVNETRDRLVCADRERDELQVAVNETRDQVIRSRHETEVLRASLAHAERELVRTRQDLSTLRQTLSDLETWRSRLIHKLTLEDGPWEVRLVLPLARIARTVLPAGKSEMGARSGLAPSGPKKRGTRRKLKKALKRTRRLARRATVSALRRTLPPLAAWFALRFPKVFAKLRDDVRQRTGGEAAPPVLSAATLPPQVLEDALLTIALHNHTTLAETGASLSQSALIAADKIRE